MTPQDEKKALDALEFAQGAILDAIGLEDGLDGAAGAAVIRMIRDALTANGRALTPLPDDTTEAMYASTAERLYQSAAEVAQLRQDREDCRENCRRTYANSVELAKHVGKEKTRADELEAARDHLRARLREQIEAWQNSAAYYLDDHGDDDTHGRDKARGEIQQQCAADLLAVLTEPEEKK